ncbi:major facilitator superfamily domain-containing protein [Mucidula mucida]|nr:major facilitator superfamily domain-containing protein [Mucidula mucida]
MADSKELSPKSSAVISVDEVVARPYQYSPAEVEGFTVDPATSRHICRQYDLRIMPIIFCMYLFSALDRGNLGNAKTDGLNNDLGLVGNQYNNILTIQSATFAGMAIFGGYITKRFGASRMMPTYMFFGGIMIVRYFLGSFEGLFGPTVPIYLTSFYTRGELAKRLAVWYSSTAISGAFSGLLSYGVFQIESSIPGWKILFLIEGGLTVLVAIIASFTLPAFPQRCPWLTDNEKEVAVMRLLKDSSQSVDAEFTHKEFFAPAKDWKFYILMIFALTYGTASSTATTFLPQLISRFEFSAVKTNLYTVAPNLVAVVYLLTIASLSDFFRQRTIFLAVAMTTTMTGCIILAATSIHQIGVGYFACFLIQCGAHVPTTMFHSWHNNNDPSENGRAFRTGTLTLAANAGSLISANIFLDSWAPKYTKALIISACLQVLGISIVLSLRTYMALENKKRNKQQGVNWKTEDVPTVALVEGPKNKHFRYFL